MSSVSVIIPTFQRRALLPRALDSVLAQTRPADEVIVVDDASTDHTHALWLERYAERGVRYERLFDNRGVSAARNHGIAVAAGAWIALLDSDDAWRPEKLERQLAALAASPGHRLCHSEEIWIRHGRRVNPHAKHEKAGGEIFARCLPRCVISPSSVLLASALFDELGCFDTTLPACEDYDLWLRICAQEPVLFVDEPLIVKYGGHDDQLSRRYYGIDRFRIRALAKLLETTTLDAEQRAAALATLREKIAIYVAGAEKRGRGGDPEIERLRRQQV